MALSAEMVIMDVMAITAGMPIVTIIALMASTFMRDATLENIVKIPDIDMVIMAAADITDVMATLSAMNTLF